jgi:hypothetical protein
MSGASVKRGSSRRCCSDASTRPPQRLGTEGLDRYFGSWVVDPILLPVEDVGRGPVRLELWTEDHGELHLDGTISVPRSLHPQNGVGEGAISELVRKRSR